MGIKRIVDTSFWTDGKVDEFSPEDKYFMLYLLTNPFSRQLGIYEISIRQVAFQLGYSEDSVKALLERFENKYGMLLFSRETSEIAILNFLRHSVMKGGKPVEDCIRQDMERVKNKRLIDEVFLHLYGRDGLNVTVKKIIDEYINENDIHNDNDNDRTGNDSWTNRDRIVEEPQTQPKPAKPVRHKYGMYNNVLLSDEDLEKLKTEFSDWEQRIERLSEYIASAGKSYKNHLATIRSWARKDKDKKTYGKRTAEEKNEGFCFTQPTDDLPF